VLTLPGSASGSMAGQSECRDSANARQMLLPQRKPPKNQGRDAHAIVSSVIEVERHCDSDCDHSDDEEVIDLSDSSTSDIDAMNYSSEVVDCCLSACVFFKLILGECVTRRYCFSVAILNLFYWFTSPGCPSHFDLFV